MDQIIGREGEMATLAETVSAAVAGSPRFLVLEGPPGIGKSNLPSAAALTAEQAGARVLRARGNPEVSELAFGVVGQLFELALDGEPEEGRRAWLQCPAAGRPDDSEPRHPPDGRSPRVRPRRADRARTPADQFATMPITQDGTL